MPRRFVWIDDSDLFSAKAKLKAVREKQIPDWKWIRWVDDEYPSADEAFHALMAEVGIPSMFNAGKAIYFFGLPKTHSQLAESLKKIPDGVVLIMIARINKTYSLYKAAMELKDSAKIIELPEFGSHDGTHSREYDWIVDRARVLGANIDSLAVSSLLDAFGFVPNILHQELQKLVHLAKDGAIAHWMVDEASDGSGEVDIFNLGDAMTHDKPDVAHEIMKRLLDGGDSPFAILGLLHDWSMKLCLAAEASSCDDEAMKRLIGNCLKWEKKIEKKEDTESAPPSLAEEDYDFKKGKPVKMFASPKFLYHSCKALDDSDRSRSWPTMVLYRVVEAQFSLRSESLATSGNKHLLADRMHRLVDDIIIIGERHEQGN